MDNKQDVKVVSKPNDVVGKMNISLCNFSLKQQKLIEYIILQSKKTVYQISWADANNLLNLDIRNMKQTQKKQLVADLITLTLLLESEQGDIDVYPIFSHIRLSNEGIIYFELNSSAFAALAVIGGSYFNVNLYELAKFKHQYSNLIFQKLKSDFNSYERGKWNLKYDVKTFRKWLGVQNKYKKFEQLREKVINKSIKEINEFTDLEIVKFYKVRGVEEICFVVCNKKTTGDYLKEKNEEFNNSIERKPRNKKYSEPVYETFDTSDVDKLTKLEREDLLLNVYKRS